MADIDTDQVMRFFHDHPERPWHVQDIQRRLKLDDRGTLRGLLADLVDRGELVRTRRRTYGLPQEMNLIVGKLQVASGGYGFVISDAGGKDLFIPADRLGGAWDTDRVIARPSPQRGDDDRPSGEIVRIVERGYQQVVGTLEYARGYAILRPDSVRLRERILLTPESVGKLEGGSRIVVRMVWPEVSGEKEPFGEVVEFLGESDDPEVETRAVIVKHGLKAEFDADTMAEAKAVPDHVTSEMMGGRTDYRKINTMTVDGEDAKDFDDAISVERLDSTAGGLLRVGIHIADVSYYVAEGTSLDEEAVERATSVYLPGKVLPMLPEELSNGICSLEESQARLALSVFVDITRTGEVKSFKLKETVIESDARLTYEQVQEFSDGGRLPQGKRKLERDVKVLLNLTQDLRKARLGAGALDFHFTEAKVDVDDEGTLHVTPIRSDEARQMIEELMLLANRLVAQELTRRDIPALYRIHEDPSDEKIAALQKALSKLGYTLDLEHTGPQDLQNILRQAAGKPEAQLVSTLLLRSLKQAKYSAEDLGHFGLAFKSYLHFTSPIRRYPDLVVHRVVRGMLQHRLSPTLKERMRTDFPVLAEHISVRERVAEDAERDLTRYFHARWAKDEIGTAFTGIIVGVTNFGVFLELPNGVEGLMHVSHLEDDYYLYLEDSLMLMGKHTRKKYRLGDRVEVRILAANPTQRQIDLIPADMEMPEVEPEDRVIVTRPPKVLKSPMQGVAEGVAEDSRNGRSGRKGGADKAGAPAKARGKQGDAKADKPAAKAKAEQPAAKAKGEKAAAAKSKPAEGKRQPAEGKENGAKKKPARDGKATKAAAPAAKAQAERSRTDKTKSSRPAESDTTGKEKAPKRKKRRVLRFG